MLLLAGCAGHSGIGSNAPDSRLVVKQATAASDVNLFKVVSNVGGAGNVKARIDSDGDLFLDGAITAGSVTIALGAADLAEMTPVEGDRESYQVGELVAVSPDGLKVRRSSGAFDRAVVGVVTDRGGYLGMPADLSARRDNWTQGVIAREYNAVKVGICGYVRCRVTSQGGPIRPGDLLVASSTPGCAMRFEPEDPAKATTFEELKAILARNARALGAIVGKAREAFDGGRDRGIRGRRP